MIPSKVIVFAFYLYHHVCNWIVSSRLWCARREMSEKRYDICNNKRFMLNSSVMSSIVLSLSVQSSSEVWAFHASMLMTRDLRYVEHSSSLWIFGRGYTCLLNVTFVIRSCQDALTVKSVHSEIGFCSHLDPTTWRGSCSCGSRRRVPSLQLRSQWGVDS